MLIPIRHHCWDVSPQEAIRLQQQLAPLIDLTGDITYVETVAGIDVGIKHGIARAAVVVMTFPGLQIIERRLAEEAVTFPYVPGLLSFRELPVILLALANLESAPDLLICDSQGYAHPRRMGLATHLGILLDHPTIGCAKSRLCGIYEQPKEQRGSYTWLYDGEERIGAAVRTRTRVQPVFVSVGHRIALERAIDIILRCGGGYRLPEPTRWAHHIASTII